MMETIGYIAALFIGLSLGLIGGGGSILTLPVLVYLFGLSPIVATSYSLFVVGTTSSVGALSNYRKGTIDMKTALLFGLSSIVTVFIVRSRILLHIPDHFTIGLLSIRFAVITMAFFALMMLLASVSMIRSNTITDIAPGKKKNIPMLLFYGIGIGFITGFLGAGGGFLLIPALVLLLQVPMKKAIGTSLLIITLNSSAGFLGDIGHFRINWPLLLGITTTAIIGLVFGDMLNKRIDARHLRKGFGWFVLIMGTYIFIREIFISL